MATDNEWLYGTPLAGDIADYRMVRVQFCKGPDQDYVMHKDHVARFVEATVKLHFDPGINPATGARCARIWRVSSAPINGSTYWWCVPNLGKNNDPEGAVIAHPGRADELFIDREFARTLG